MAKLVFIMSTQAELTEELICRHFTKARFRRDLEDIDDDDLAIMNDPDFRLQDVIDLECSATVVVITENEEVSDEDRNAILMANSAIGLSWVPVAHLSHSLWGILRFAGEKTPSPTDEVDVINAIEEVLQQ